MTRPPIHASIGEVRTQKIHGSVPLKGPPCPVITICLATLGNRNMKRPTGNLPNSRSSVPQRDVVFSLALVTGPTHYVFKLRCYFLRWRSASAWPMPRLLRLMLLHAAVFTVPLILPIPWRVSLVVNRCSVEFLCASVQ